MDASLEILILALCVLGSALYSGSEIGFYSLSPVQVDLEARQGGRTARIVRLLLRDDSALLITILIGNNLALELATLAGDRLLGGAHDTRDALVVTAVLTPLVFLFGEALPKDIFRRRPHALIGLGAYFLLLSRIVFWPLERLLWLVSHGLERLLGLKTGVVAQVRGAETVRAFFEAGREAGALTERAAVLAHNALLMRSTPIERAMVPWEAVLRLSTEASPADQVATVRRSRYSRLPAVDPQGVVQGYVHQMDVLFGDGEAAPLDKLRGVLALTADTPVDRALQTLRAGGHRAAVVGELDAPVGWVTLKDLVEEISGDLVGL